MKSPRPTTPTDADPQRIAKVMARAGLCSRREAETWIADGRVSLNGTVLESPAVTVKPGDVVLVDGQPLPERERTRLWLFHKPRGLVTTTRDPEGRQTVFDALPPDLPRVMTVGRLDINTEGLLLLTNDGGLARVLELPATGWLRRYRVRAHGDIDQARLDALADGIAVDGVFYGAIEATLDRQQGDNVWLTMGLREGKNREIKNVLMHLGLDVNRLIRLSFGPFQLGDLADGEVREVPRRHLKDQLGEALAAAAGADLSVREDDRRPKMPAPSEVRPAAAHRDGRPARAPDAGRARRRHEADVAHNAGVEAPRRRETLAFKGARSGPAEPEAERPTGQKSRRELIEEKRAGRGRRDAVVERRPRRAAEPEPVLPGRRPGGSISDAAGRMGPPRSAGKGRGSPGRAAVPDEAWDMRPRRAHETDVGRDATRPPRRERDDRPDRPVRAAKDGLRSRGMRTVDGARGAEAPSRARGTRSAEPGRAPRPAGAPRAGRPREDERPAGQARPAGVRPDRTGDARPRGDRPSGDRPGGGKPRGDRPSGDRPGGGKPRGDRPSGDRPGGGKPRGDRPSGDRPGGGKPRGDRPSGDRPGGGKPRGGKPGGMKPGRPGGAGADRRR
jgi:23S rRNA pseudouridine2605 synthase